MKPKLVICDNDGTLVNDAHELTERTKNAIEKIHSEEILFGMASGRDYPQIREYAQKWGLSFDFDIVIGINGCQLWNNRTQTAKEYFKLNDDQKTRIVEFMKPFDMNMQFLANDKVYFQRVDELMSASVKRNRNESIVVIFGDDPDLIYQLELFNVVFRGTPEKVALIEEELRKHPLEGIKGFKTQPFVFEFTCENVSKATALIEFCEDEGISLEEVMAFGDTTNDNEMLECCYGICVANSSEDTKAVSKLILPYTNNEDAVARYLEEL
ncbi:MAG: HAD family hydrolase [Erysipelotrichaceae bacterium]|nr:HAD family hydrolase [Erysipelotrichaceae bacterium]